MSDLSAEAGAHVSRPLPSRIDDVMLHRGRHLLKYLLPPETRIANPGPYPNIGKTLLSFLESVRGTDGLRLTDLAAPRSRPLTIQ